MFVYNINQRSYFEFKAGFMVYFFNSIQFIRNARYASKQNKHAGANKQNFIKARTLRKRSKYLLFFSLSLKSLNKLQRKL